MTRSSEAQVQTRLMRVRRERGWRRSVVEEHMRWPPGTLRHLERGKVTLTFADAYTMCSLYEYDLSALAGNAGPDGGDRGEGA